MVSCPPHPRWFLWHGEYTKESQRLLGTVEPTLPLDPAEVPGRENHEPKRDSVPGESLEIVAADIAYQGAHGERRAHEGCDRTDPDDREIIDFDGVARFEEFQHRRAEYGRYRQEKRKLGGGRPGKSAQQAAHDRCTRARRAGDHRQGLRKSDPDRVRRLNVVDSRDSRGSLAALDP